MALLAVFEQCEPYPLGSALDQARVRLARAMDTWRPIEGRLVGGFAYAPISTASPPQGLSKVLRETVANSAVDPLDGFALAGIVALIGGDPEKAIFNLEKATSARPGRADFLSDLAAAYLARAQTERDHLSLLQAVESAARAVATDPNLQEARFNLALALESLSLDIQARESWERFLRLDPRSGWAKEARARLLSLPRPGSAAKSWSLTKGELDAAALRNDASAVTRLVRSHLQAAREYAEEQLLGRWAREQLAGDTSKAADTLRITRAIGDALANVNRELMVAMTVRAIDDAAANSNQLERLANGHALYQEGLELIEKGQIPGAAKRFGQARDLLQRAGSPFNAWATFRVMVCGVLHFQYDKAIHIFHSLQASPEGRSYQSLVARAWWIAGLIHGIQARPTESVAAFRKAVRIFAFLGEVENAANANARLGESLELFGDLEGAWSHFAIALRGLHALREPARREFVLEAGSLTALRMGKPHAALALQQEAVATLPASADPAVWIYCLRRRALIEIRAGLLAQARRDLAATRGWLPKVSDPLLRGSLLGDILAVEVQAGGADTVAKLSELIEIYRDTGLQPLYPIFVGRRAKAQAGLGRFDFAEADYREAITAISRQHAAIQERDLRDWFLAGARSIFEGMVRLQADRRDPWQALSYAEKGRAQLFQEQSGGEAGARPLDAREIANRMPAGTALVEYFITDRELLAWVVRSGSVELVRTPVVPAILSRWIEQFRHEVQSGAKPSDSAAARSLSKILLGRLRPLLQNARTLVLVPDGDLYEVPFAALRDVSGRYLIEDYALIVNPSASLYIQALAAERKRPRRTWASAMVLGDPSLDREVLTNLPQLRRSREEARQIASIYPEAALKIGPEATKEQFLEGLARYDILHFAGHAVTRQGAPSLSFLALAPSTDEDSGILYARDLYALPTSNARLVVLSACGTIQGDAHVGEGVAGLARPFLSAGVPSLVGTLWEVNDRIAESVLVGFHQALRSGLSSSEALRRSQIEVLKAQSTSWEGFQVSGAGL